MINVTLEFDSSRCLISILRSLTDFIREIEDIPGVDRISISMNTSDDARATQSTVAEKYAVALAVSHDRMIVNSDAGNGDLAEPVPDEPVGSLSKEAADWLIGLNRGSHPFRSVPRSIRRELIQSVIEACRPPDGGRPSQVDFNVRRYKWMSTANSACITFGVRWSDLCDGKGE